MNSKLQCKVSIFCNCFARQNSSVGDGFINLTIKFIQRFFHEATPRCQKYIYCVRPPCHMQRHWEILLVKRTEYRQCQLGNCVLIFANWYAFKRNCWLLWMALWFEVSVNSLRLKDKLVGFEKSVFVSGWKEILFHSPKLPRTFCHRLMICLQVWQLIRKDLEKRKCLKYWRNIPEKM